MFQIPNVDRHWGCRIDDQIMWHGLRSILLQNEYIQLVILVDKGTEIIQFLYKPLDVDFIWRGPNSLHDLRHFGRPATTSGSTFFDHWSGGWFETVPNGGSFSEYKNAPYENFAETINIPWEHRILENNPKLVRIGLWVRTCRSPYLLQKTMTIQAGIPALFIEECLTNEGTEPMDFMWGHHPVVGAPFLDETCRLFAPDCTVEVFDAEDGPDYRMGLHQKGNWPFIEDRQGRALDLSIIPPRSSRTMDNCYLSGFKEGWIAINNPTLGIGFGIAWDPAVFQHTWIWEAFGGGIGYPWYGRTYNIGLEPWTSYPCAGLSEIIRRGTAMHLEPDCSLNTWLTAVAFTDQHNVNCIRRDGTVF
jgi:hypothetical protein